MIQQREETELDQLSRQHNHLNLRINTQIDDNFQFDSTHDEENQTNGGVVTTIEDDAILIE